MKIAFIHSVYRDGAASGENVAVESQMKALSDAGETVYSFSRAFEGDSEDLATRLRLGLSVASGRGANPNQWLDEIEPDVVHVHNTFPNIGTNWIAKCRYPVFATVHNYRTICAAGTLSRQGRECLDCPKHGSLNAVLHACYRGSRLATLPLAFANRNGIQDSYLALEKVTPIFLSERQRNQFHDLGLARTDSHVVHNFVPAHELKTFPPEERDGFIFVGRLSQEKGIAELVEAWNQTLKLVVIGDGPLRETIVRKSHASKKNIIFKGKLHHDQVLELLGRAKALVFPSLWSEGLPTVALESFSLGVPVLTMKGNSAADFISVKGGGIVSDSMEALVKVCESLEPFWPRLSREAKSLFEENFTVEVWLNSMKQIYSGVA